MTGRAAQLAAFLARAEWADANRTPLAGDASTRRYERLAFPDGRRAVLMDADPATDHGTDAFIRIARWLCEAGLSAPKILAQDGKAGFLLLEDLGDGRFSDLIARDPSIEAPLYEAAVDTLLSLRGRGLPEGLVTFTPAHMAAMIAPVFEFYGQGIGAERRQALTGLLETSLAPVSTVESVLCLRDCHAENLIWMPARKGVARVGLLDFQDAVAAHPAYDLVSLLQDARRDVSPDVADAMIDRFILHGGFDPAMLRAIYPVIGVQRHLRILGVFGRLASRFGKPGYLHLMPRVWGHLMHCLDHPQLGALRDLVIRTLPEPDISTLNRLKSHDPA